MVQTARVFAIAAGAFLLAGGVYGSATKQWANRTIERRRQADRAARVVGGVFITIGSASLVIALLLPCLVWSCDAATPTVFSRSRGAFVLTGLRAISIHQRGRAYRSADGRQRQIDGIVRFPGGGRFETPLTSHRAVILLLGSRVRPRWRSIVAAPSRSLCRGRLCLRERTTPGQPFVQRGTAGRRPRLGKHQRESPSRTGRTAANQVGRETSR
jgi:hypothetical protein